MSICKFNFGGICNNADCIVEGYECTESDQKKCDLCVQAETVEPDVMDDEHAAPCRFADKDGFCCNEKHQGGGYKCIKCADYSTATHQAPQTFSVTMKHRTVQLPMADALKFQYAKVGKAAGAAVREMVIFGAMLEKVDDSLTKARHNPDGSGVSLKSWLEANCPEINYQTAKSYQRAAEGVRVLVKMADDVPLLPIIGADAKESGLDDAARKTREEVLGVISNSSLNVLRRAALPIPVGNKLKGTHGIAQGRRALTAEENAAEAEKTMRELMGSVGAYLRGPWFGMLTEASQDDMLRTLKHYAETVEDRMREAAMDR